MDAKSSRTPMPSKREKRVVEVACALVDSMRYQLRFTLTETICDQYPRDRRQRIAPVNLRDYNIRRPPELFQPSDKQRLCECRAYIYPRAPDGGGWTTKDET